MKGFASLLYGMIIVPFGIVLAKLMHYMLTNNFQEWWITIVWVLVLPLVTLSFVIARRDK